MKTIQINDTKIGYEHQVRTDPNTHHVYVDVSFEAEGKRVTHVMTVGANDQPLASSYDQVALQADLDAHVDRHAKLFESKLRAEKLAKALS
jgi:hypothetical protein